MQFIVKKNRKITQVIWNKYGRIEREGWRGKSLIYVDKKSCCANELERDHAKASKYVYV
jgi:hypothetical protein